MPDVKVEPATPTTPEDPPDLFKDMVPVIHATKKVIHIKYDISRLQIH